jgi:hypothetical protein
VTLRHNILKAYWKLKLPYNRREIYRGVNDVDVWLCSPGGAGSNMLKDYLHQFVRVKSPMMAGLLTHHSEPVNCHKPNFKAIYLHRHPLDAVQSMKRRGLVRTNIRKLNNKRGLPATEVFLLESVLRQFKNWTTREVNYPIICVKYESLFENRNLLGEFLGLGFQNFPEPKYSQNHQETGLDLTEYADSIAAWEAFPEVLIREPR